MYFSGSLLLALFGGIYSDITVVARKWHNTGGSIVFEEAYTVPDMLSQVGNSTAALGGTNAELRANLLDISGHRIDLMNQNDIDFMILSCAQPCVQGISEPEKAAQMAITLNNQLAASIANNTERLGGFAALSMHNATVAAQELKRAVRELGFFGALLNDYQQAGADGQTLLYYDQPEYDPFWEMVTELDVPVYMHPRVNIPTIHNLEFSHAPALGGAVQEFAVTLSNHILGLCINGVFDRFPKLKIIVGHLGERIPSDLVRIDSALIRPNNQGLPMKQNVTTYFKTNIFETTSGNFAPELLDFHISQIGLDRIMYSIDYPFVNIPDGTAFLKTLSKRMKRQDYDSFIRGLAIKLQALTITHEKIPKFELLASGGTNAELKANLVDIEGRIPLMDQNNIDFMVLSCATPCVQGFSDPEQADQLAVSLNNRLAATIANNTERLGAFAALSMHNATVAAQELKRAVQELGFVGALLNDYQASGSDGQTPLYYDQPQYDVFWQMVTDLDVPVYLHPQNTLPIVSSLDFGHAPQLLGPVQEYAVTLSTHILG
ncbi:hypothetical protein CVT24_008730 [Panaeolus cyanescens]|uniref:Amidohydrolase-related domain-containing protein n=1 Tax=Panaeolus cyanescens TaxID=181874 RepID=A0A409VCU3_9AGAR|nr:hypothetical protein CVT24_008730 [Panaeolus cyanescens]